MLLLVLGVSAQSSIKYETYYNQRFDYCMEYPASFTKGIEPTNGDGLSFHHKKLDSSISTYDALQMPRETLQSLFEAEQKKTKSTYSALKEKQNFFVLSGFVEENGHIFYRRATLKNDVFLTVIYEYPSNQRSYFDKVIKDSSSNFSICR